MGRGRKRKFDPTIPSHIDQAALPGGLYWDRSGAGRWYVVETKPEGGARKVTVASAKARLSELHEITENRGAGAQRGTLDAIWTAFKDSTEYRALAKGTQRDYRIHAAVVKDFKTRQGHFGALRADALTTAIVQRLVEAIALGTPESKPGAGDGVAGRPSKANHVLRYLRRLLAWGMRFGHCKTNAAIGVREAPEASKAKGAKAKKLPTATAYTAIRALAIESGARAAHSKGSCPPYLQHVITIAYSCRLRGIEVIDLTDGDVLEVGLLCRRRKGSLTNITAWSPELRGAVSALQEFRKKAVVAHRGANIVPLKATDRALVYSEDGSPLNKSSLDSAWGRLMDRAIVEGVITAEQRFTLHGLKHKGVTDTRGTKSEKKDASGHVSDKAFTIYDHEFAVVPAAGLEPVEHSKNGLFSGEFSGGKEKGATRDA